MNIPLSFLFLFLKTILVISLIFCIMGISQKFFCALSLVSFFLFQGWLYGVYFEQQMILMCLTTPILFVLFSSVCLFSPICNRWTVLFWIKKIGSGNKVKNKENVKNYYPVWPRLLVILTIALTLFGSFSCKFDTSGFQWINGYTLQGYLLMNSARRFSLTKGYWLAQQNFYLIWFLNIGVYIFQSTAPLGFLF